MTAPPLNRPIEYSSQLVSATQTRRNTLPRQHDIQFPNLVPTGALDIDRDRVVAYRDVFAVHLERVALQLRRIRPPTALAALVHRHLVSRTSNAIMYGKTVHRLSCSLHMDHVSVNRFRDNLKSLVDQVYNRHDPLKVTRRGGADFVVVSVQDWEREQETL